MSEKITPPSKGITDTWLKRLRPTGKRVEFSDPSTPGLRVRLAPKQLLITFIWRVKIGGKISTHTLGHYPELSLADARLKLLQLKAQHRAGNLDSASDTKAKQKREDLLLSEAMDAWYDTIRSRRKRPEKVRQVIDAEIYGLRKDFTGNALGTKPLKEVTKKDVVGLVNSTICRGAAEHAMTILATLKQFFRWVEDTMDLPDPIHRLQRKTFGISTKRKSEEHILDIVNGEPVKALPEIKRFLLLLDESSISLKIKNALKILLLTGVRVNELLLTERKHLSVNSWFIPAENTKTNSEWIVPISAHAYELFLQLEGDLFKGTDRNAVNRALQRLRERHQLPKFTVHTLRKTFRSHIAEMTDFETAELCLNHSLGYIAAKYDKSTGLAKRRDVLKRWSQKILDGYPQ